MERFPDASDCDDDTKRSPVNVSDDTSTKTDATVHESLPSQHPRKEKLTKNVYIIILALIIDLLGFTLILPLQPSLLEYYKSFGKDGLYSYIENKIHVFQDYLGIPEAFNTVLFGGLLGSLFSCLQFLFSPIIGALSDVYGRKPVLLVTMVGVAFSHGIWLFADSFYMFVIARIIGGMSRGNISLSAAIVTDLCSTKLRGKGMALIGIAFSIGFIVGPMIGASLLVKNGFSSLPPLVALGFATLDVLFLLFFFDESLPRHKRAASVTTGLSDAFSYINPYSLFSFKPVKNVNTKDLNLMSKIGRIYFMFLFLYSGLEFTLTFLVHERFKFSGMQQGRMYFFSGIVMTVFQGTYVRKLEAGKELRGAVYGIAAAIPAFIIVGLSQNSYFMYIGLFMYAFTSATVVPCFSTVISKLGSDDQKGKILGTFRSLGYLARGLGPFISALGYWCVGSCWCYCIEGLLLLVPLHYVYNALLDVERSLPKKVH